MSHLRHAVIPKPLFTKHMRDLMSMGRFAEMPHNWQARITTDELKSVYSAKYLYIKGLVLNHTPLPRNWDGGLTNDQIEDIYKTRGYRTLCEGKNYVASKINAVLEMARCGKGHFFGSEYAYYGSEDIKCRFRYYGTKNVRIDLYRHTDLIDVIKSLRKQSRDGTKNRRVPMRLVRKINKNGCTSRENSRQLRALGFVA